MSEPLKVGDLVEIVSVFYEENSRLVGNIGRIVSVNQFVGEFTGRSTGYKLDTDSHANGRYWIATQLRRIPPKDDFQKADEDFCLWLKSVTGVRV